MKTAGSFSPNNITAGEVIAVATDAGIVLMHMKTYPRTRRKRSSGKTAVPRTATTGTSFFEAVYEIVRQIPSGRVTTYGAIAEAAGTRLSARMVGWALNSAGSAATPVPAHRVVNRNGMLSGRHHFATPTLMRELLEQEGVEVKEDAVVRFKELYWEPA